MRTGTLAFAVTASGLLGGIAGALLVQGTGAPAAAPAGAPGTGVVPDHSPPPDRALADLANRVDVLEANLGNAVAETAKVREGLQAALDEERKAGAAARERLEALESSGPRGLADGSFAFGGRPGEAGAARALPQVAMRLPESMRKAGELRALPEEERWQKAREALGLTGYQEEELKAAMKEYDEGMREAMKVESREVTVGDGGGAAAISISMPDMGKMRDARKRYTERVDQALNVDQAKKWREEGYEGGIAGGMGPGFFISRSVISTEGGEDK